MKVVPLTIISSDLLAKILLPISMTLDSADLKDLVSEGEMLPPEVKTMILLNWKLKLPNSHFDLTSLNQQAKKGIIVLASAIDLSY